MTSSLNMIRGRSNIVTLTNNSGGALVSGDVCVQDTSADEKVTTTTSAASVLKVFVAAESIASGAAGRFYESGYCPLVNVNASVTRGRFLFTHTAAKQAAESATYASGAFGKILKSGTTPSAIIYSATAQVGAGGSGNVTSTSAFASPPGSPASGDLWLPNNSFYLLRYSGSAQIPWGPIYPLTAPPAASDFTWENQNTAAVAETNGGIVMTLPGTVTGGNGYDLRNLYKAATPPYTITACFVTTLTPTSFRGYHLGFRKSSDGSIATFGIYYDATNGVVLASRKWTSATQWSANYTSTNNAERILNPGGPVWLRISDNNTNRICSYSNDGINFITYHTIGRTDFLTADQVLWGGFTQNTASDTNYIDLVSWG